MHIETEVTGSAIVALAIMAHAWSGHIDANPKVMSVIGWVVNGLAAAALASCWFRG